MILKYENYQEKSVMISRLVIKINNNYTLFSSTKRAKKSIKFNCVHNVYFEIKVIS